MDNYFKEHELEYVPNILVIYCENQINLSKSSILNVTAHSFTYKYKIQSYFSYNFDTDKFDSFCVSYDDNIVKWYRYTDYKVIPNSNTMEGLIFFYENDTLRLQKLGKTISMSAKNETKYNIDGRLSGMRSSSVCESKFRGSAMTPPRSVEKDKVKNRSSKKKRNMGSEKSSNAESPLMIKSLEDDDKYPENIENKTVELNFTQEIITEKKGDDFIEPKNIPKIYLPTFTIDSFGNSDAINVRMINWYSIKGMETLKEVKKE